MHRGAGGDAQGGGGGCTCILCIPPGYAPVCSYLIEQTIRFCNEAPFNIILYYIALPLGSVSDLDPDPVGSTFKLGRDPDLYSESGFGFRIQVSTNRFKKLKFTRTDLNDENRKML
jgi:hypothetical protein